jgi:hypothetical protein
MTQFKNEEKKWCKNIVSSREEEYWNVGRSSEVEKMIKYGGYFANNI